MMKKLISLLLTMILALGLLAPAALAGDFGEDEDYSIYGRTWRAGVEFTF